MKLLCPTCGSKDLWQPHTKTSFDRILENHGYGRYDCRNCWKRSIFRFDRRLHRENSRREAEAAPPVRPEPAREEIATEQMLPVTPVATAVATPSPVPMPSPVPVPRPEEPTVVGATVLISGEISSSEGMTIRGVLEGAVTMDGCRLVIEAGGTVAADVSAGSIAVCRDGTLTGQVKTPSFVVDDGANFNGKIELVTR
jgi:cytoskeletal protein CcmA (bactofilin family)